MDIAEIDELGKGILYNGTANVVSVEWDRNGTPGIFKLTVKYQLPDDSMKNIVTAQPGQFFLIQAIPSAVQFLRPISVYKSTVEHLKAGAVDSRVVTVEFLILQKGTGTQELSQLTEGADVKLIGPLGNIWPQPEEDGVCIIGGGIGVAPVANFAASLKDESYDFYASFKSGGCGMEYVKPKELYVSTDDGSAGVKGIFPVLLDAQKIKERGYKTVYACGPTPLLAYVQKICEEAAVKCWLSMENKMACGVGACLGCTIQTKEGNRRVCKDGPIFDGSILQFESPKGKRPIPLDSDEVPNLEVTIAGVKFQNPVIAASGTFGFGQNYRGVADVNKIGGISSKGMTLNPKAGNNGTRLVEITGGCINSIGLENPGVKAFIQNELPRMMELKPTAIANLAGSDLETYVEGAKLLDKSNVPMIELNISCPNVKAGGMAFGMECNSAATVVKAVREATTKPLIVKLSPNAPDLRGVAMACVKAGADGLSLVNTVQAMAIDIEKGEPVFENVRAGMCGPAIKPLALRMVYDVVEEMNKLPEEQRVPVIGIGGIANWRDAVEFIMAGASAIQVGTATFSNPKAMEEIVDGLYSYMKSHGYKTISDFRGIAQKK